MDNFKKPNPGEIVEITDTLKQVIHKAAKAECEKRGVANCDPCLEFALIVESMSLDNIGVLPTSNEVEVEQYHDGVVWTERNGAWGGFDIIEVSDDYRVVVHGPTSRVFAVKLGTEDGVYDVGGDVIIFVDGGTPAEVAWVDEFEDLETVLNAYSDQSAWNPKTEEEVFPPDYAD